jgi:hypothetical protein
MGQAEWVHGITHVARFSRGEKERRGESAGQRAKLLGPSLGKSPWARRRTGVHGAMVAGAYSDTPPSLSASPQWGQALNQTTPALAPPQPRTRCVQ